MGSTWFSHRASPGYNSQPHQEASHALETHLAHFPEDSGAVPRRRWSNIFPSRIVWQTFQGISGIPSGVQVGSKLGPKNRNLSGYNVEVYMNWWVRGGQTSDYWSVLVCCARSLAHESPMAEALMYEQALLRDERVETTG